MIEIFWRRFDARNAQARNPRRKKIFVSTTSLPSTLLFRKRTCVCSSLLPATDNISTKSLCFNHFFCLHFNFWKRTWVCLSLLPTADYGFTKKSFCLNHMNRIQFTHMFTFSFLLPTADWTFFLLLQSPIFLMYASFLVHGRTLPTSSP